MTLDIIVPVYRNADLVAACLGSLMANLGEVAGLAPRLIIINDSSDDDAVNRLLTEWAEAAEVVIITNPLNLGFVKSVNKGLAQARARGSAALLVNSDTVTFPGTLAELVAVLNADPQIGFVCPRSNNASIATLPWPPHALAGTCVTPEASHRAWDAIRSRLPRYSWAPTAVGFYMLIAPAVVTNFGTLDEAFGLGYEEENDLVMRAGKVGWRAVLANQAFAWHAGSASFLLKDGLDLAGQQQGNLAMMSERHPEFLPLVRAYEASAEYRGEVQLRTLVPAEDGRLKVALYMPSIGKHHNGTAEMMLHIVRWCDAHAPDQFEIHAICDHGVAAFHGIDRLGRVKIRPALAPDYALAILLGQPFDLGMVSAMEQLAPINVYGMLDMIALDCGHLRAGNGLDRLWAHVAHHANGLFFISKFAEQTMRRRFSRQFASAVHTQLMPTRLAAYRERYQGIELRHEHVLVMGNHFPHKGSIAAAELIARQLPEVAAVVLGDTSKMQSGLRMLQAGIVPDADMVELFARASVVVLPSHYEGFGLSLLHALAMGKPVVARDIPPTREILATFARVSGVLLFSADADMPALIRQAIKEGRSSVEEGETIDWDHWSSGLFTFATSLIDAPNVHARLLDRIEASDLLAMSTRAMCFADADVAMATRVDLAALLSLKGAMFVRALFEQLLGRPAGPADIAHHVGLLDAGMAPVDMVQAILASDEFSRRTTGIELVNEAVLHVRALPASRPGLLARLLGRA